MVSTATTTCRKCLLICQSVTHYCYFLLLNSSILDIKGDCSSGGLREPQHHFTPTGYLCRNDCMIDKNRCTSRCRVDTRTSKTHCKYGRLPKQCKVCCDDVGDIEQEVETVLTNALAELNSVKVLPSD